jgi:hypothetical protein
MATINGMSKLVTKIPAVIAVRTAVDVFAFGRYTGVDIDLRIYR